MNPTKKYASTQVETASRERLMVMLFEATLRHVRTAAQALEEGRAKDAREPIFKSVEIISEMLQTLDHSKAPALCAQLQDLYVFINDRLLKATVSKSATLVREAERVLAPIVHGFAQAVASLPQAGSATGGPVNPAK